MRSPKTLVTLAQFYEEFKRSGKDTIIRKELHDMKFKPSQVEMIIKTFFTETNDYKGYTKKHYRLRDMKPNEDEEEFFNRLGRSFFYSDSEQLQSYINYYFKVSELNVYSTVYSLVEPNLEKTIIDNIYKEINDYKELLKIAKD